MEKKSLNNEFASTKCKYRVIAQDIQLNIFLNRMKANTPLPSIRSYAEKYSVSQNTIVCAFRSLKDNGIICSNRTKNYCVSEEIEQIRIIIADKLIHNLITNMKHLGYSQKEFLQIFNDYLDMAEAGDSMGKC